MIRFCEIMLFDSNDIELCQNPSNNQKANKQTGWIFCLNSGQKLKIEQPLK